MSTKISQREARRLKKRVEELETNDRYRRDRWKKDWVGGVRIGSGTFNDVLTAKVTTARLLEHAVVVTVDGNDLAFFACKI